MRQRSKRVVSLVAMLALLLALLPSGLVSPASAAVNIGDPAVLQNGDTVYYGVYPQGEITSITGLIENVDYVVSSGANYAIQPIAWRVLDRGSGELLLLSEKNLDVQPYHVNDEAVTWAGSTVRSWLNGYADGSNIAGVGYSGAGDSFISNAFAAAERVSIATTRVINNVIHSYIDAETGISYTFPGGLDTDDQIFFLSYSEADNRTTSMYFPAPDPMSSPADARIAYNTAYTAAAHSFMEPAGDPDFWWLRTPSGESSDLSYKATQVDWNGELADEGGEVTSPYLAVRPAFNLDLGSVLFSSDASGTMKSAATPGGDLVEVANTSGAVKLTVKNDYNATTNPTGLGLTITDPSSRTAAPGATVDIAYTGARTGVNRSVSVLLCDSTGDLLYYGRPGDCATNADGTASFTVPASLPNGSYTIKIFNEEVNAANYTDFASTPQLISLTVGASSYKPGDINRDGDVNVRDLSILLENYGLPVEDRTNPNADINNDGDVNVRDLSIILENYGK